MSEMVRKKAIERIELLEKTELGRYMGNNPCYPGEVSPMLPKSGATVRYL